MKIGIAFDFHDIFVNSKQAWRETFKLFDKSDSSISLLDRGFSRKYISKLIGKDFRIVEKEYRKRLKPIKENIDLLKELNKGFKIFLVSRSSKARLINDLSKFNLTKYFNKIYSKEDSITLSEILNRITKENNFDFLIFLNHDLNRFYRNGKIVYCPITFCNSFEEFKDKSFVDHAKDKLLYHKLSKKYFLALEKNTPKEINFLIKIFKRYGNKAQNILDLGCGAGRHSIPLAKKGLSVVGVDLSRDLLEHARNCCERFKSNNKIKFINKDIREINFEKDSFDAAICMWTTYNYLSKKEDISNFLSRVHSCLKDQGLLILDAKNIINLSYIRAYKRESENKNFQIFLLIFKRIIKNIQNGHYLYFIKNKKTNRKYFLHDEELAKFYTLSELKHFVKNKFEVINVFGDFNGNLFNAKKSERFIIVLRKKN